MNTQFQTHVPRGARAALAPLWKAFACSQDLRIDPWEFALPLQHLADLGVDQSDLRWLVLHGYVTFRNRARRYQPSPNAGVSVDPRLMITEVGLLVADPSAAAEDSSPGRSLNSADIISVNSHVPQWDRRRRRLSFDGCVVKQFRLPASNQEAVLSAFEAEGWPASIDDPLPFLPELPAKERLHVTIRHLNANHQNRLIRFRGNGTGEAVLWQPIAASAMDRPMVALGSRRAA